MDYIEQGGQLFQTNFGELGLSVKFVKGFASPLGDTYLYDLTYVSQYNKNYLKSLLEKIAVYHHLDIELIDTKEAHFGVFVHKACQKLSLTQCLWESGQHDIVIGKDNYGNLVKIDFESTPHLLIGGTTGSGKSVLLHNLLVNLMSYYRTSNEANRFRKALQLVIIDPKGTELCMYRNMRNTTFVDNTQRAITMLKQVEQEMDKRYANGNNYLSDIYVIIDELADLMLTSKFEVEQSIVRLAQKGRACGIHLIVATQSPRCDVISGIIKVNFATRISLKTASVRDSVVIIDQKGSEQLNIGEALMKNGATLTKLKIAFAEKETENNFINSNRG